VPTELSAPLPAGFTTSMAALSAAAGAFARADERAPEALPAAGVSAVGVSLDTTGAVAGGVSAHQSTGTARD